MAIEYVPFHGPIVTRRQAKAGGLQRYFMGPDKPCKRGHISERKTCDGRCIQCTRVSAMDADQVKAKRRRTKAWDDGHRKQKNQGSRERYQQLKETVGDEGMRERFRTSYRKYRDVALKATKAWQKRNPEKLKAYQDATKDRRVETSKRWAKANPERAAAKTRRWQAKNPNAWREYRKNNPEAYRATKLRYRALLASAEGNHTGDELKALFEKQGGRCAYCGRSIRNGYDADHIVPLSRGGSNWITNIQLCCASCNRRKWAHDHAEFARRLTSKE